MLPGTQQCVDVHLIYIYTLQTTVTIHKRTQYSTIDFCAYAYTTDICIWCRHVTYTAKAKCTKAAVGVHTALTWVYDL